MEIRKWTTVDVNYDEDESKLANKERKRLEKLGYDYQQTDAGVDYDYDDQYIKNGRVRLVVKNDKP